ncbi:carboxymuconolactone decarboxylase family protein [Sneathiella glossodoripedis]|uniref:carboxymuconolactone decarboxylase family protein n=1 Tax=Sneathiella glossodoripedis TaxID=418853 RepID=UPI0004716C2D|nr:carboxymuconolactone decarboxylase family protein [Sneathiella glossodoripedis]
MTELVDIYYEKATLLAKAMELGGHNGHLPQELYHSIKLRSMQVADCGPCLQLSITMAGRAGLSKEMIAAILKGDLQDMPRFVQLGWNYADAILNRTDKIDEYCREIEIEFGKRGLWDASLAVVYGQFYPILKRGLGIAQSCSPVSVLLEDLAVAG